MGGGFSKSRKPLIGDALGDKISGMKEKLIRSRKILSVMAALALLLCVLTACSAPTSTEWAISVIGDYYYEEVDLSGASSMSPDEIAEEYLDAFSAYYTAEEYAEVFASNAGEMQNAGFSVGVIEGYAYVYLCNGNSPAWEAGVRVGDRVLRAETRDGETLDFVNAPYESLDAALSETAEGNIARFVFEREGREKTFEYRTAAYDQSYVLMATNSEAWSFTGSGALTMTSSPDDVISYLPEGTAYISLSGFHGNAAEQFALACARFAELGLDALILDLRNNGGGYIDVACHIAACFEGSAGKVFMSYGGRAYEGEYYAYRAEEGRYIPSSAKVYVMMNGNSASASEALVGCLIDYGVTERRNIFLSSYDAEDIGADPSLFKSGSSYGKGCMQQNFTNRWTGEVLHLTTALIYWPSGETIHGRGLRVEDGCVANPAPYISSAVNAEVENVARVIAERNAAYARQE